ncbi:HAD hydrolase-like protein [Pseudomonas syringae]|uniref:HAD hydrolase-like protein n=1 Tax=Pseudomonas syringae TaxID=317 RepID=UPI000E323308|nr:HAD hydrolase-like protein [Pseudomonas syringae]
MRFDSLLFDIDGTLLLKGQPLPGAADALSFARSQGLRLQLLTNTTAKMPEELAEELCRAGIEVVPDEIQTATTACLGYLQQHPHLKCHLLVPDSIRPVFRGIATDDTNPDVVVISDDVLTDCAGAKAVGASSLLVRTGKYDPRLFEAHRQNVDAVIEGIAEFPRWWMSGSAAGHLRQG